jgi:translocation and assembly module TamA
MMMIKKCVFPIKTWILTKVFWLFFLFVFSFCLTTIEAYQVQFEGINDTELLELIQSSSQLEKLKANDPSTKKGLKRRAESDISNILQVLQSRAYYDAKVNFTINRDKSIVHVMIKTGAVYPLKTFRIRYLQNEKEISESDLRQCITLKDLHVELGKPAFPETILNAGETLLDKLNLQGYAFAAITKQDVFADQLSQNIIVLLVVDVGSLSFFGPLKIKGNHRLRQEFFFKKLRWTEGEIYNPVLIEKTQEALELSGVFKSITINKADKPAADGTIPIDISVLEGKQRSMGFGLSYDTDLGIGLTADWEDRNIAGEGEKLSARADLWSKVQKANITYLLPDFLQQEQNLVWSLNYLHEDIKAYTESSFSFSGIIERKISDSFHFSYGAMYKFLRSERSSRNGTFDLIKIPIEWRWTTTGSLLDPIQGMTAKLKIVPSLQFLSPQFTYSINTFTGTYYIPVKKDRRVILAVKLMLGSIIGASKHDIPTPERFLIGSDSTLRGYRFESVSPLGEDGKKPLGGRSLFVYSLELRQRFGENYGIVYFWELGNVYKNSYINIFETRMLQSAGFGFRYYTPIGPLRLDFAFPLTPRRHLDPKFMYYFSIGQTY